MEKNRILKNSIWLAVMVTSLLLLAVCALLALQDGGFGCFGGGFAKETPREAFILTERIFSILW